jgi:energy-coupling factor transport system ATP-binding protein
MDEPTRGMDRARKAELVAWLDDLAAAGAAVLVATHDVEFAAALAERVVLLADGRVIADGPARTILAGGWYFATEVARIVGDAAISAEGGAELIRERRRGADPAPATVTAGGGSP